MSFFHGPSIWSPASVLCIEMGYDPATDVIAQHAETVIVAALSERARHNPLSLALQTPPDSTDPCAWAGWLALNMQRSIGIPVEHAYQRMNLVAFEARHQPIAIDAARLAVHVANSAMARGDAPPELQKSIDRLTERNLNYDHGPAGRAFAATARRRGIPISTVDPQGRYIEFGNGRYRRRIHRTRTSNTGEIALSISGDKLVTIAYLRDAGIPVPRSLGAYSVETAIEAAQRIGYPVVLKPNHLSNAVSVYVDIRNEEELRNRFETETGGQPGRLLNRVVEQFIKGNTYRALVVGENVVAAYQRVIPHVIGDGVHSISQLLAVENALPLRNIGEFKQIAVDDEALLVLERQGFELDSIPPPGRRVELKPQIGHRLQGGIVRDCTDELHPINAALLVQAAGVIGLDVAGIDFVTPDVAQPIVAASGAIIEVNASPVIDRHLRPGIGVSRDPTGPILDTLFPAGQPVRVPIIAVTGERETTSVTELIGSLLAGAGHAVGIASTARISAAGIELQREDVTSFASARKVLNNRSVELAVLEAPPHEIVQEGLGFEYCDVAVVTSHSDASPAGFPSAEAVLCRNADPGGLLVLNADDPRCIELGRSFANPKLLYGLNPESEAMTEHLRNGGRAVGVRWKANGATLSLFGSDGHAEPILNLESDETTFAEGPIQTLAAASAAVVGFGVSIEVLRPLLSNRRVLQ